MIDQDYKNYLLEQHIPVVEMSTGAATTTDGVDNPDPAPIGVKKKTVFGKPCFEVDEDTYHKCVQGKIPFKRWTKYVEDENVRNELKSTYQKNKKVLIQNSKTGGMVYLK